MKFVVTILSIPVLFILSLFLPLLILAGYLQFCIYYNLNSWGTGALGTVAFILGILPAALFILYAFDYVIEDKNSEFVKIIKDMKKAIRQERAERRIKDRHKQKEAELKQFEDKKADVANWLATKN